MNKLTDIGSAFETLKDWMKQHQKPADKLGMTYEEWEERLWSIMIEHRQGVALIWTTDSELRELFDQGLWPYAAFKKLESNRKS